MIKPAMSDRATVYTAAATRRSPCLNTPCRTYAIKNESIGNLSAEG